LSSTMSLFFSHYANNGPLSSNFERSFSFETINDRVSNLTFR